MKVLPQITWIPWEQGEGDIYDVSGYRSGEQYGHPSKEGYVFAGWYWDKGMTVPLEKAATRGHAYGEFVNKDVLSIKWQVSSGTTSATPKTALRLLTTVDSLNYNSVGFRFQIGDGRENIRISTTVYSQIKSKEDGVTFRYQPSVFHESSRYFMTRTVTDVPSQYYDRVWRVTPFWITLDGTAVDGQLRTFKITDYTDR